MAEKRQEGDAISNLRPDNLKKRDNMYAEHYDVGKGGPIPQDFDSLKEVTLMIISVSP